MTVMSDLNHPLFARTYIKLKVHLHAVFHAFLKAPLTVVQVNWLKHVLYELVSHVPNLHLHALDRELEKMAKIKPDIKVSEPMIPSAGSSPEPDPKRRRVSGPVSPSPELLPDTKLRSVVIPDTLCVVYSEQRVWQHMCHMWNLVKELIDVHNAVSKTEPHTMFGILSTLKTRVQNLQFLLSHTCWRPCFFSAPRRLAPRANQEICAPDKPSPAALPNTTAPVTAATPVTSHPQEQCVSTGMSCSHPSASISETTIKKECHPSCPGGLPCLST